MQKRMMTIFLLVALILSGLLSLYSMGNLQGNARVINYTGVVRGATQRLVKEELEGHRDDALISRLDGIIEELRTAAYISSELQECAKIASQLDRRMLSLNEAIQKCSAAADSSVL